MHPGTSLTDKMREWATPVASMVNYDEQPENFEARSERLEAEGSRPLGANLGQQSKTWSTPQAHEAQGTPSEGFNEKSLTRDAAVWQTPTVGAATNGNATRGGERSSEQLLKGQATRWPTAAASDFKGSTQIGQRRGQLSEAILKHGHQAPETPKDGDESSAPIPSSVRLSPAFVEWLMNWPPGFSLPFPMRRLNRTGQIDSESLETV